VSTHRPPPAARLEHPEAVLSRSDLRELGYQRRAVDAIFRACPVVVLPGYSRPVIRVSEYLNLIREHTFNGRDRVR
jgi:hypothetical protein